MPRLRPEQARTPNRLRFKKPSELIIERRVLINLKATEQLLQVHHAMYLKLTNFDIVLFRDGLRMHLFIVVLYVLCG